MFLILGWQKLQWCLVVKLDLLPFSCLGLPIGGDNRKLNFWTPLVDHIKSRLLVWKSRSFSMGSLGSCEVCHVISSGLLPFLLQGSRRYFLLLNLFFLWGVGILGK